MRPFILLLTIMVGLVCLGCAGQFPLTSMEVNEVGHKLVNDGADLGHKVVDYSGDAFVLIDALVNDLVDAGQDLYCVIAECDETPLSP